jgi:sodium/bile acid cotransporter 7
VSQILRRLRIDPYICAILGMVALASALPVRGNGAAVFGDITKGAIALLFFLYGARLSPTEAFNGFKHWRLHAIILASTFVLFPLLGLSTRLLVPHILTPDLYVGVMFLCTLPSTVQSSIAFTSIARGNVAAAICSASFSNLIGIFLTPVLVAIFLSANGGGLSLSALQAIVLQLLAPFALGQLVRPWISGWVSRNKQIVSLVDRGSILLVVYTAFSAGVVAGIWSQVSIGSLAWLMVIDIALLATVLFVTSTAARRLAFNREDHIAIVFCGSKKSLASGLPMAAVLFAGQNVALIALPLMLFHQIQLIWCAALARRYAAHEPAFDAPAIWEQGHHDARGPARAET